jgi:hypothetical protein
MAKVANSLSVATFHSKWSFLPSPGRVAFLQQGQKRTNVHGRDRRRLVRCDCSQPLVAHPGPSGTSAI